jgi:hypothetical protein
MRLTKIKQNQLDEAYDTLIQVCLYDRPLKDMEPYLADDVMNFGAGRKELTRTKKAFLRQIKNQKKLAAGLKMDFRIKPVLRKIINRGDGAIYTDDIINTVWVNGIKNKLTFRLSFIFEYCNRKWIMVHSHTSTPDPQRTDDEVWPVEKLKKRTAVLEKSLEEKIAELQVKNRELEIEAALEKVRARTMAMRDSEELPEVASLLFKQITDLGTKSWSSGFMIGEPEGNTINSRMSRPDGSIGIPFNIPLTEDSFFINIYEARQRGENFFVMESGGKELEETYRYMFSLPEAAKAMGSIENLGFQMPTFQITHCVFFSHGFLMFITYEPCPEMWDIFKRFGKSFEQTYTRFLDLQKAEAQAREAQVEAALERIRSRSLAMNHSGELKEVITVTFEKLSELNVLPGTVGIQLFDQGSMNSVAWVGTTIQDPQMVNLPYDKQIMDDDNFLKDAWKSMTNGVDIINKEYSFEQKNQYFNHLFANNDLTQIPQQARDFLMQMRRHIVCVFPNKNSAFFVDSWNGEIFPKENQDVIKRAAKVFEQAYIRFLDLQKAEAQAREAQIQLALERLRARTMAMHQSAELAEVASVMFEQLSLLGASLWICGFNICKVDSEIMEGWVCPPDGKMMPPMYLLIQLTSFQLLLIKPGKIRGRCTLILWKDPNYSRVMKS